MKKNEKEGSDASSKWIERVTVFIYEERII